MEGLGPPVGAAALYAVRSGGKRIRPILLLASHRAAGGWPEGPDAAIYDVAAAVELVHAYSLLHDDLPVMDDDPLRRGLPTAHRVYGVPATTAAGGALQSLAFLALGRAAEKDPDVEAALPEMIRRLAAAAGAEGMVGGQFLDLEAEGRPVDAAGLEAIHRGKTAALLSAACALGALAASAAADTVDALADYGTNLGLAFQIVDDLLDEAGDPERTGKAGGSDRARDKTTYPAVHGMEESRRHAEIAADQARAALDRLDGAAGTDVLAETVDFVLGRMA